MRCHSAPVYLCVYRWLCVRVCACACARARRRCRGGAAGRRVAAHRIATDRRVTYSAACFASFAVQIHRTARFVRSCRSVRLHYVAFRANRVASATRPCVAACGGAWRRGQRNAAVRRVAPPFSQQCPLKSLPFCVPSDFIDAHLRAQFVAAVFHGLC